MSNSKVKTSKTKKVSEKMAHNDAVFQLLADYSLSSYPYDNSSSWVDILVVLDGVSQDPKIAFYQMEMAGLIDRETGTWHEALTNHGLVTQITFMEVDRATGYSGIVKTDLVSDLGRNFFEALFYNTINSIK